MTVAKLEEQCKRDAESFIKAEKVKKIQLSILTPLLYIYLFLLLFIHLFCIDTSFSISAFLTGIKMRCEQQK